MIHTLTPMLAEDRRAALRAEASSWNRSIRRPRPRIALGAGARHVIDGLRRDVERLQLGPVANGCLTC